MNFIIEYKKGQEGGNKGLPMGNGLINISNALNGVQKHRIYGIASPPKTGKTTFVDNGFMIEPYLYCKENNIPLEIIYYSFEIDRISKEFDVAVHFLYRDYGIFYIELPQGITKEGESVIELDSDYLRGRVVDDNGDIIKVKPVIEEKLKEVYEKYIIPMFGEYSVEGIPLSKGIITFIEQKDNPTGIKNFLLDHAAENGKFIKVQAGKRERIVGYKPNDENKYTIVITDHLRKLIPERGFSEKQNVDKYIEYSVELRNWLHYTFVHIIHTNRNLASQERMRFAKDTLYPTAEDVKSTGNLSEEADYLITLFNPNDDRYKLNEHFGLKIKDEAGNILFPKLRTAHLVESRHTKYPQHFKMNMLGNVKAFEQINI